MNKQSNILVRILARLFRPVIDEVIRQHRYERFITPNRTETRVNSDWFNQIQEEIEQVVLDAGLNDKSEARLREALQSLLSGAKESDRTETPLSPIKTEDAAKETVIAEIVDFMRRMEINQILAVNAFAACLHAGAIQPGVLGVISAALEYREDE